MTKVRVCVIIRGKHAGNGGLDKGKKWDVE